MEKQIGFAKRQVKGGNVYRYGLLFLAFFSILVTGSSAANPPGADNSADGGLGVKVQGSVERRDRDNSSFWEQLGTVRSEKLALYLELSSEDSKLVVPIIQALSRHRKEVQVERNAALDRLDGLLKQRAGEADLLRAVRDFQRQEVEAFQKEQRLTADLLRALTPEKQARYYLFNRYFSNQVRQGLYRMAEQRLKNRQDGPDTGPSRKVSTPPPPPGQP